MNIVQVEKPWEVSWTNADGSEVFWEEFHTKKEADTFMSKAKTDKTKYEPLLARWHKIGLDWEME